MRRSLPDRLADEDDHGVREERGRAEGHRALRTNAPQKPGLLQRDALRPPRFGPLRFRLAVVRGNASEECAVLHVDDRWTLEVRTR